MSGATPRPAEAAVGLQVLAEVIERGLNIVERDCEVFGQPVPTGAEIQMMVRRQDVLDIRAVLAERAAHKQAVEALRPLAALAEFYCDNEVMAVARIQAGRDRTLSLTGADVHRAARALAAVDEASK